jgi:hypothetical protein
VHRRPRIVGEPVVAALLKTTTLFFCFATSTTANAGAEAVTSISGSTRSRSNHSRALLAAMSGLF